MARGRKRRRNKKRVFIAYFLRTVCVLILAGLLCAAFFLIKSVVGNISVGSSSKAVDENTIEVAKNGQITGDICEAFDKDYYNEDELSNLVDTEILEYNRLAGEKDAVKKLAFDVEDGKAKVSLSYKSAADYRGFNERELYVDTVKNLIAGGFSFNQNLMDVSDSTSFISSTDISKIEDYKAIVTKEDVMLSCPGKILYYTSNVDLQGKNLGRTKPQGGYAVVIYK